MTSSKPKSEWNCESPHVLFAMRATLLSHVLNVVVGPVAMIMAGIAMSWLKLLLTAVVVLVSICAGTKFDLPKIDQESIFTAFMIFACFAGFIWTASVPLCIWDHYKYEGWDLGSKKQEQGVDQFLGPFLSENFSEAYSRCSETYRMRHTFERFAASAEQLNHGLGSHRWIQTLDRRGWFQLPILAGAIPLLNSFSLKLNDMVALVLFDNPDLPADPNHIPALRMRVISESNEYLIDDFDLVEVSLNQTQF